jgi:hypothetical protein
MPARLTSETLIKGTNELVCYALIPVLEWQPGLQKPLGTKLKDHPLVEGCGALGEFGNYVLTGGYEHIGRLDASGVSWVRAPFCKDYDGTATTPATPVKTTYGYIDEDWPDVLLNEIDFNFSSNFPLILANGATTGRPLINPALKQGGRFKSKTRLDIYLSNNGTFPGVQRDDPQAVPGMIPWDYYGHRAQLTCLHADQYVPGQPQTYANGTPNQDGGKGRMHYATNRTDWVAFTKPAMPELTSAGIWQLSVLTVFPPVGAALIEDQT